MMQTILNGEELGRALALVFGSDAQAQQMAIAPGGLKDCLEQVAGHVDILERGMDPGPQRVLAHTWVGHVHLWIYSTGEVVFVCDQALAPEDEVVLREAGFRSHLEIDAAALAE